MSDTILRDNERNKTIDLISYINIVATSAELSIKSASGEKTISTKKKIMFPDILLFGDDSKRIILQGWESKMPDVKITNTEFINDATCKAEALRLNSFVLWNFGYARLYIREKDDSSFVSVKDWSCPQIHTRQDVSKYEDEWHNMANEVISEVNDYLSNGKIRKAKIEDALFDNLASTLISRNIDSVSNELKTRAIKDNRIEAYVKDWRQNVELYYINSELDPYKAYAKAILVNWVNKFLFSHMIKVKHDSAKDVERISNSIKPAQALEYFLKITEKSDFYNIFSKIKYSEFISNESWEDLTDLNTFLTDYLSLQIDHEVLQSILEKTADMSSRQVVGQFTTPPTLSDILVGITMRKRDGQFIDPCCGTGTIAKSCFRAKKHSGVSASDSVLQTWASDKFSLPLQIANLALADIDALDVPNIIFQKNVFELSPNSNISIVNPSDGNTQIFTPGKFDTICSNLPFIEFERIDKEERLIIDSLSKQLKQKTGITLSERSDYYSYIIFYLSRLMEDSGRLGVIISNSWLGTDWGIQFYTALTKIFTVEQVHISGHGKWFTNADVVTTILVLSETKDPPEADKTTFYTWEKSLEEIKANESIKDDIINHAVLEKTNSTENVRVSQYDWATINKDIGSGVCLNAHFHSIEWFSKVEPKLCDVNSLFKVTRGERRGWNEMFYPSSGHKIEPTYIRHLLKSSRHLSGLIANTSHEAFCCSASKEDLLSNGEKGAYNWIQKFETIKNNVGKPLPEVLARANSFWYEMSDASTADIITSMNPDKRLFFSKFAEPTFIDQRLIALSAKDGTDVNLLHALLNSILGIFLLEASGFGRGLGALDISRSKLQRLKVLNPDLLNTTQIDNIKLKFRSLLSRDVLDLESELMQKDRESFDKVVLKAFGLENDYKNIKKSLLSMYQSRQSAKI